MENTRILILIYINFFFIVKNQQEFLYQPSL